MNTDHVAYCIIAHSPGEQLFLLIETLAKAPASRLYLHIDAKAEVPPPFLHLLEVNRVVLVDRVRVNWGGYTMIQATANLLSAALDAPENQRIALLSGTCFPLRPAAELSQALLLGEDAFSLWRTLARPDDVLRDPAATAVEKRHFMDVEFLNPSRGKIRRAMFNLATLVNRWLPYRRRPPIPIVKGSQWFVAKRETAARLLDALPSVETFFRGSFAPDETALQSLYALGGGDAASRFVDQHAPVQGRHYIAFRPSGQRSRWDRLRRKVDQRAATALDIRDALTTDALFIRKCSIERCHEILRLTERHTS